MGIKDLFLPKIERSNPEVRKEAVLEEVDLVLLKQVSEEDADPEVRQLALERLEALSVSASVS